ncbi:MAG: starvation/stationary phase protection protein [Naasia sp.]|jgi:starvation-inducible DNA-binding protein|uniref:Dps family protein n=1 Tax=Naasia sp. TaxID=2546198 RepID=UPI0026370052|nr:DNA starvation/stationary phase protection protein [Naasia sp.]MCU1569379.1 starvation/stationary phase protection protein [Naasia sp.]
MTDSPTKSKAKTRAKAENADYVWGSEVASGVAELLQPVLVHLTALHVDGKQAHWHVRGRDFIDVHELLDLYVEHVREWADEVAERVVALGLPVDGRIATVASATTTPEFPEGFQNVPDTIAAVVTQIDATLEVLHTSIEEIEEIDPGSQDVLIEIERGLVKDRWFLQAHIADD